MGCRIIEEPAGFACMYDSVTMTAFGPVFDGGQELENFLAWLGDDVDPRKLAADELAELHAEFLDEEEKLPQDVRALPYALRGEP